MVQQKKNMEEETVTEWEGLAMRERSILSVRSEYFHSVIFDTLHLSPHEQNVLHIGGRRGLFAQEVARQGFHVSCIDASEAAIAFASEQAQQQGLTIDYRVGLAENLPYADASFDIVYCSDTLEVTNNLDEVIREASRVLKKGGTFLYDTVNRTMPGKLVYLFVFQTWSWTNIMPPHRYDQSRLITPQHISKIMQAHDLDNQHIVEFKPERLSQLIGAVRAYKRGRISADEVGARVHMKLAKQDKNPAVTYLGYGIKR